MFAKAPELTLAPLASRRPQVPLTQRVAAAFHAWRLRERQRTEVARMSAREAADFGTTPQQLQFELERPIARAIRWL